ncbi:LacI family DNA-binding transcriptional regulator [Psychromicrobium lacuslunae]|uniref:LacI family transcriptional regulator n=1 Tax=Psychromicrobium lacuslunae TaxID=1618207 RepID=A0A0D4C1T8_9MICC|nr:LacI family DNA-binding transcriptional regulator [Psychromicrobium lacuslunae]AJT42637.1 LacI family transcriptional regulator [Psychromicrobium lacuslunae]
MANLKTLAERVGVSVSTVSNAYNKPEQLSAELRTKILKTAEEIGYSGPDAAARALRSGRADTVGVLLTERLSYAFSDPYAVLMLSGLTAACEKKGTGVLLMPVIGEQGGSLPLNNAAIDAATAFCLRPEHEALKRIRARGIRFVGEDISDDPESSWVAIDERAAGRSLGRHLYKLGHRNIVIVSSACIANGEPAARLADASDLLNLDDWGRYNGILDEMPGARVEVVDSSPNSIESGEKAAELILDRQQRPTAIVCLSDVHALGVLRALKVRGIVPGKDLSVTGFDDIPAAEAAGLTTVRQSAYEKGRLIGELMLDPESQPRQIILPTEFIIRSSTGPAPLAP